ncbi:hypothetical protein V8E36_002739 [Tilletia maclaganii]
MLKDQMRSALERRRERSTLRSLTVRDTTARRAEASSASSSATSSITVEPLADFSSNDYLSLASSSEMREAFVERVLRARTHPLGSTGSRLLDGNSSEHEELEHRLMRFFESPAALFFGSGFEANVSIFSTLPQPGDLILYDELIHASVHDGMRQSRAAHCLAFKHNDLGDLERTLRQFCCVDSSSASGLQVRTDFAQRLRRRQSNVFIAVEAVYSMDGDLCPLPSLVRFAERCVPKECLQIVVDEAHSTGTYGAQGRGLAHALGLHQHDRVHIRLATFGKACGASGAVVLCEPLVREYLINYARPFIFSTAPPAAVVMAAHSAIDMFEREDVGDRRRTQMVDMTNLLIASLREAVLYAATSRPEDRSGRALLALVPALAQPADGRASEVEQDPTALLAPSPIVPLLTPFPRPLSAYLQSRGFLVRPITYPTVPLGQDRVRICVHAGNTEQQIRGLGAAVREWVDLIHAQARTKSSAFDGSTVGAPRIERRSSKSSLAETPATVSALPRESRRTEVPIRPKL